MGICDIFTPQPICISGYFDPNLRMTVMIKRVTHVCRKFQSVGVGTMYHTFQFTLMKNT